MSNFKAFSKAVHDQFHAMSKEGELFVVDIDGDALYAAYQAAFPPGTNEIFRTNREHECSCCKNFIRNIGNVVAIKDGQLVTVWDVSGIPQPYQEVAIRLSSLIKGTGMTAMPALPIKSIFRAEMPKYGEEQTKETNPLNNTQITWNHFYSGPIDKKFYVKDQAATQIGEANNRVGVFKRGLEELKLPAFETVLDLINGNSLYRGTEHLTTVNEFMSLLGQYQASNTKEAFLWQNYKHFAAPFRNTVIGTLVTDLSDGVDLETAVKSFEKKVAPENYKRTSALITPGMIKEATKTIEALGIEDSLQRRFARISDVNVNDILFVDQGAKHLMKGTIAGLLADALAPAKVKEESALDVSIEDFMKSVLPQTKSMELFIKNAHQGNFVSLTAPVHADAPNIFKWNNGFAWSYDGNVTDSIKERVKAAGGNVEGALRISLAWFNYDDLDLHVKEKGTASRSGYEIYFGSRNRTSPLGGQLDVDMNAGYGKVRNAVENVTYPVLKDGSYEVIVNNFNKRETNDQGFTIELAVNGNIQHFTAKKSPSSGQSNYVCQFQIKGGQLDSLTVGAGIEAQAMSQEKWGVSTEQFHKVTTMMLSPNHWGDQGVGNKHYIFVLDGCTNPVPTRGIYNEYLKSELDKHRKVFEVLGQKTMCQPDANGQLSGLGFSSTRQDSVIIKTDSGRLYNVKF